MLGQVGQVGEGLVLGLAVLAVGTAREVRLVDLALVLAPGCGYVTGASSFRHIMIVTPWAWPVNLAECAVVATPVSTKPPTRPT